MKRLATIFAIIMAGLTANAEVATESFTRRDRVIHKSDESGVREKIF